MRNSIYSSINDQSGRIIIDTSAVNGTETFRLNMSCTIVILAVLLLFVKFF